MSRLEKQAMRNRKLRDKKNQDRAARRAAKRSRRAERKACGKSPHSDRSERKRRSNYSARGYDLVHDDYFPCSLRLHSRCSMIKSVVISTNNGSWG